MVSSVNVDQTIETTVQTTQILIRESICGDNT